MSDEMKDWMTAWAETLYQRWITEAMFAGYIALPYPQDVPVLVGYNPQRLLADHRPFSEQFLQKMATAFGLPYE